MYFTVYSFLHNTSSWEHNVSSSNATSSGENWTFHNGSCRRTSTENIQGFTSYSTSVNLHSKHWMHCKIITDKSTKKDRPLKEGSYANGWLSGRDETGISTLILWGKIINTWFDKETKQRKMAATVTPLYKSFAYTTVIKIKQKLSYYIYQQDFIRKRVNQENNS